MSAAGRTCRTRLSFVGKRAKCPAIRMTNRFFRQSLGFTLIELLVVVSIIMLLTIVAVPALGPAREEKRLREGARAIHTYLGSARSRAAELGRNVGVMLERQQTMQYDAGTRQSTLVATFSRACLTLYQVEQPPIYAGDVDGATVVVQMKPAQSTGGQFSYDEDGNITYYDIAFRPTVFGTLNYTLLRVGDYVRFNNQGPRYRITGPIDPRNRTNFISITQQNPWILATTKDNPTIASQRMGSLPWPFPKNNQFPDNAEPTSQPVSYVFYRQPMRSPVSPLELPTAVAIDLQFSGNDSHYLTSTDVGMGTPITFAPGWIRASGTETRPGDPLPVYIMFAPNGSIAEVYATSPAADTSASPSRPGLQMYWPTEPLYLLVGDRGRIKSNIDVATLPTTPADDEYPNWNRLASLWLVLNPQTGLIRIAENYPIVTTNTSIVGTSFRWNASTLGTTYSNNTFSYWNSVYSTTNTTMANYNLSSSVWRKAIVQSRSFARGSFYDGVNARLMPLAQGADDLVGGR